MTFRELRATERRAIMAHILLVLGDYLQDIGMEPEEMARHAGVLAHALHRQLAGKRHLDIRTEALLGMSDYNSALSNIDGILQWDDEMDEVRAFFARTIISLHLFSDSAEECALLIHNTFAETFGDAWSAGYTPPGSLLSVCGGEPDAEVPHGELLRREGTMTNIDRYYLLSHISDVPACV